MSFLGEGGGAGSGEEADLRPAHLTSLSCVSEPGLRTIRPWISCVGLLHSTTGTQTRGSRVQVRRRDSSERSAARERTEPPDGREREGKAGRNDRGLHGSFTAETQRAAAGDPELVGPAEGGV